MMRILDQILQVKKEEVKRIRRTCSLSQFADSEFFEKKIMPFTSSLEDRSRIGIIAEIKKASPSRGLIRADFDHMKIADTYFNHEVNAVSVLTDKQFFQGDIKFMSDIAGIKSAPLLRKDFIIDEYQIFEARSYGADMILLIAEALSAGQILELTHAAGELGLEVLLEFHSETQIGKIDFGLNRLIGINNRNLDNFNTDLSTTLSLSEQLPDDLFLVSESGIKHEDDLRRLGQTKTAAILVGEHLISAPDLDQALKTLKDWCQHAR
jgi:indole-3-glycerol phosphate synthase